MCDGYCNLITVDNMMNVYYPRETRKVSLRDKESVACLVGRKDHSASNKKSISGAQKSRTKKSNQPDDINRKPPLQYESNRKSQQPTQQVVVNTHINVVAHTHQLITHRQQAPQPIAIGSSTSHVKLATRNPPSPKTVNYKNNQLQPQPNHKQQVTSEYFPCGQKSQVTIQKNAQQQYSSGKSSLTDPYRLTDQAVTRQCSAKNLIKDVVRIPKPPTFKTEASSESSLPPNSRQAIQDIPTQLHLPNHRNTVGPSKQPVNFQQLCPKSTFSEGQNVPSEVSGESNVIEKVKFRHTAGCGRLPS